MCGDLLNVVSVKLRLPVENHLGLDLAAIIRKSGVKRGGDIVHGVTSPRSSWTNFPISIPHRCKNTWE